MTADLDIVREALYAVSGEIDPVFETTPHDRLGAYLEKTPKELNGWLPEVCPKVFENVVQVNWELADSSIWSSSSCRCRAGCVSRQSRTSRSFRKSWTNCCASCSPNGTRIEMHTIAEQNQGYSKAFVFQVTPLDCDGDGPVMIAKIGECSMIEREVRRFRNYLEHYARRQSQSGGDDLGAAHAHPRRHDLSPSMDWAAKSATFPSFSTAPKTAR